VGLAGLRPGLLPASLIPPLWDGAARLRRLRRNGVSLPAEVVWSSVLRGHLSMMYFVYFHLVRYYLAPLAAAGLVAPGAWLLASVAVLYAAAVDYSVKKPRLSFPAYLGYYLAEHGAYQAGVVLGCLRAGTWRSYAVALRGTKQD
jgi:mycofactocin glycosyltransferase